MDKKIILSTSQYDNLIKFINETTTTPTPLKNILNDNPSIKYISFVRNDGQKINFVLSTTDGHTSIKNIQKNAMYFNSVGQFRPNTMIYGNDVYLTYQIRMVKNPETNNLEAKDGLWKETLKNIVSVEVYDGSSNMLDSMELDSDTASDEKPTKPVDDLINDYNADFSNLKDGQQFTIVGSTTQNGVMISRTGDLMTFELTSKGTTYTCEFQMSSAGPAQHIFRKSADGTIIFTAVKFVVKGMKTNKAPFTLKNIKDFIVKATTKTPEEQEQEKAEDEARKAKEAEDAAKKKTDDDAAAAQKADADSRTNADNRRKFEKSNKELGKEIYNSIINDPLMKKAFFNQPTLLGMIQAGDPVGIVPAKKLIDSYLLKDTEKKLGELGKKFAINSTITFEVVGNDLVIKDADNFTATVGKVYKAVVKQREVGTTYIQCLHKADSAEDKDFFLNIYPQKEQVDVEDDTYPAKIKMENLSSGGLKYNYPPSQLGKIKVINYKFN